MWRLRRLLAWSDAIGAGGRHLPSLTVYGDSSSPPRRESWQRSQAAAVKQLLNADSLYFGTE